MDDALIGGVSAEETRRRRRRKVELVQEAIHGFLEEKRSDGQGEEERLTARQEEQELLSSLLTKLGELEKDTDSDILELRKGERSKEVELADIAKDLNKIKRQNTITHLLLGAVIVLTAVWQVNEVSFLLWVQNKLSNPFKSLGDMIKGSIKLRGRRPVLESSPLPPAGVPDVSRADLPTLVIGSTQDMAGIEEDLPSASRNREALHSMSISTAEASPRHINLLPGMITAARALSYLKP